MTPSDRDIERHWRTIRAKGPCVLLAVATLLALATAELTPAAGERAAVGALVAAGFGLQLWWGRTSRTRPGPSAAGTVYYALRWALGFALTWLNPFFAFYAAAGYFDAEELIRGRRLRWAGPFACAVTVSGSQAGGLPFHQPVQWAVFAALVLVNGALLVVVGRVTAQQEERSRARAETIAELERTNAALHQALDENAALHSQLLVQAREAGVADERRRLAAEIHDTLAQGLTGIIAQLQVVAGASDLATARTHLDRASALARHSLGEARRSVHNLAPVALEHDGLPRALKGTVAEWSERTGTRADLTVTGTAEELHDELSATLLRIAQEALSNTARHAAATRVGVTLTFLGDEVILDIRDDGRGFDPDTLPERGRGGGFGLPGMRARAERIAGCLAVESEPGRGTALSARVPLVRHEP